MIRSLRLLKMVKLVTSSRMWKRWEMRFTINYGLLAMTRAVGAVAVYSHWCACLWGLQASLSDDLSVTWLGLQYKCTEHHYDMHECFAENDEFGTFWTPYLAGFYFSVATITSIGYGDVAPRTSNALELACAVLIMLSG